jgi:hypothetical protein
VILAAFCSHLSNPFQLQIIILYLQENFPPPPLAVVTNQNHNQPDAFSNAVHVGDERQSTVARYMETLSSDNCSISCLNAAHSLTADFRYLHLKNHSAVSSSTSHEMAKPIGGTLLHQRPSTGHSSSVVSAVGCVHTS